MRYNTTVDNFSPLISYTPAASWVPGVHTDPFWTEYSEGTYSVTGAVGAAATFTFSGTGIWIFGGLRDNHGQFNVTLDGANSTYSGLSPTNIFQTALFSAAGLAPGPHVVSIINSPKDTKAPYLDIDHIIWEAEVGDELAAATEKTEEDIATGFQYGPSATSWSTAVDNLAAFNGGSAHSTVSTTGYVTYTFNGSAVSIYGAIGPAQGPYNVKLDGGAAQNFTALNAEFHAQSLLYRADGLAPGSHSVVLTNAPATAGQALTIDYASFWALDQAPIVNITTTSTSQTSTSTQPTSTPTETQQSQDGPKTGVLVGAILGILGALALVGFAFVFISRRRRRKQEKEGPDMIVVTEPYDMGHTTGRFFPPTPSMQGGYHELNSSHGHSPLYPPSRPGQEQWPQQDPYGPRNDLYNLGPNQSGHSLFSGVGPTMAPGPSHSHYPPSPVNGAQYTRESAYIPSPVTGTQYPRESTYATGSESTSRYPRDPLSPSLMESPLPPIPGEAAQPPRPGLMIPPRKSASVVLPQSASDEQRREFEGLREGELRRLRKNVEGRAQDFGPVVMNPDPELPPDYSQATETLQRQPSSSTLQDNRNQ